MAEANPDDDFSFCSVCQKQTTWTTLLPHIAKSKDKGHSKFKESENYLKLKNDIDKKRKDHRNRISQLNKQKKKQYY